MFTKLLLAYLALMSMLTPPGPRNQPPVAVEDQYFLLYNPLLVVEIPVLANDSDPDGDVLKVTALPVSEGGTARIHEDGTVQVYLDWSGDYSEPEGLVAFGTYVVSDGMADSTSVWSVWYWPIIPLQTARVAGERN